MDNENQLYNNQKLSIKDQEHFGRKQIDSGNAKFMDSLVSVDKLYNNLESSLQGIDNLKPDTSIKVEGLGYLTEIDLGIPVISFTVDNIKNRGNILAIDHNGDLITYSKNIDTDKENITIRNNDSKSKTPTVTRLHSYQFNMVNKLSGVDQTGIYVESLGNEANDIKWNSVTFGGTTIKADDFTYWGSRHFFCNKNGGITLTGGKAINSTTAADSAEPAILTDIQFQACALDGPNNKLYALDNYSTGNNLYIFNLNDNLEFIKTTEIIKNKNPDTYDSVKELKIDNYNYEIVKPSIPNVYLNNLTPIKKNNPNIINGSEIELVFVGTTIGDTSGKVNLYSGTIKYGTSEGDRERAGSESDANCTNFSYDTKNTIIRRCGEQVIDDYGLKQTYTSASNEYNEIYSYNDPPKYEYRLPHSINEISNLSNIIDNENKQALKDSLDFSAFFDDEININKNKSKFSNMIEENNIYKQIHGADGSIYKAGGKIGTTIFDTGIDNPSLNNCKAFCNEKTDKCAGIVYGDATGDNQVNQCYWKIPNNTKEDRVPGFTSYKHKYIPRHQDEPGGPINIKKNIDECNKTVSSAISCNLLRGAVLDLTKLVDNDFSGLEYIKLKKEDNFSNKGEQLYNMVTNSIIAMNLDESKRNIEDNVTKFIDLEFSESTGDILVLVNGIILKYPLSNLYNLQARAGVSTLRNMVDIPITKIKKSIQELLGEYSEAIDTQNILDNNLIKRRNGELLKQVNLVNKELARLKPAESENKRLEATLNESTWGLTIRNMRLIMWIILATISVIFIMLHFVAPELVPTKILITYIILVAIIIVISRRYLSQNNIRNIETKISDFLSNFSFSKLSKLHIGNF
tara:strand:+ start:4990 stop:7560 length:2571 start_codon:yes stop_codon:yes gene_type:complete